MPWQCVFVRCGAQTERERDGRRREVSVCEVGDYYSGGAKRATALYIRVLVVHNKHMIPVSYAATYVHTTAAI